MEHRRLRRGVRGTVARLGGGGGRLAVPRHGRGVRRDGAVCRVAGPDEKLATDTEGGYACQITNSSFFPGQRSAWRPPSTALQRSSPRGGSTVGVGGRGPTWRVPVVRVQVGRVGGAGDYVGARLGGGATGVAAGAHVLRVHPRVLLVPRQPMMLVPQPRPLELRDYEDESSSSMAEGDHFGTPSGNRNDEVLSSPRTRAGPRDDAAGVRGVSAEGLSCWYA